MVLAENITSAFFEFENIFFANFLFQKLGNVLKFFFC